ncbi:MAG: leucyl aminopeptidase [Actinomycetaceae bacterium]|nr:leucyl aminopeptidase [Actinomycetaceae bacterium]
MNSLKLQTNSVASILPNSAVIVFVNPALADENTALPLRLPPEWSPSVEEAISALGFKADPGQVVCSQAPQALGAQLLVLVGLDSSSGDEAQRAEALRVASGAAVRQAPKERNLFIVSPVEQPAEVQAVSDGLLLGDYSFTSYTTKAKTPERDITLWVSDGGEILEASLAKSAEVVQGVNLARTLINTPPQAMFPAEFVTQIEAASQGIANLSCEILDEKQLKAQGYGGLVAVGQGSPNPPRLLIMRYTPDDAKSSVALVGKGITFDSGGLSLKPPKSMLTMKSDMSGAAAVCAATLVAAKRGVKVQITTFACMAENLVDSRSTRPSDVITLKSGTTVEVTNTDAEGRLVLADGLSAACDENPDMVIDIATLTGAQIVALGNRTAGVMGSEATRQAVVDAAKESGEDMWPMPLPGHLMKALDSTVADMVNTPMPAAEAGMLMAGQFLSRFVGDTPWAHIDIAGPSFNEATPWGYTPKGGTGVGVRTLLHLIEAHNR